MTLRHDDFGPRDSVKGTVLKVSSNGRYFTDQHGQPFFYLADTAWTLFKRLDHEDVEVYLQDRIAKGFTVIQAYLLRGLKVKNPYGHTPLIDKDPTRPNEAFYANIDHVINRANELGLVVGGVVTWGVHVQASYGNQRFAEEQIFTRSNAYVHGKFLGSRYKNNCVVWYLGGDKEPLDNLEVWTALAQGLKDGSGNCHLVSYHGPGAADTLPSSSLWFHHEKWLDFNVLQTGHGWTVNNYDFITHDRGLTPVKPVLDMEASYENHPDVRNITNRRIDAHQVRESMYWQMLAGAAGHGYGCNDIWGFWDEGIDQQDYSHPGNYKQNTRWQTAMDLPGAAGVGLARKLFELRPWHQMTPDQAVIAAGQGEGEDHIQAARAADGSFMIAYLTLGNPVGIHLDRLSGKKIKAQWYNPRDGHFMYIGLYTNSGVQTFTPPTNYDQDDWVLVLEDEEKKYPVELC
jgi:hypothetical protein